MARRTNRRYAVIIRIEQSDGERRRSYSHAGPTARTHRRPGQPVAPKLDDDRPWDNTNRTDSTRIIHSALDAGINVVDTADVYSAGVTSAIVGPRTMEQLQGFLPAADAVLGDDVLDRIDEIVALGVTMNRDDDSYGAHELQPGQRRRELEA